MRGEVCGSRNHDVAIKSAILIFFNGGGYTLAHVHRGGYVDALACTCQRFGALVHCYHVAHYLQLRVLALRRIAGDI